MLSTKTHKRRLLHPPSPPSFISTLCRFAYTWSILFVLQVYVGVGALGVECLFAVNANEKIQQKQNNIYFCCLFQQPFWQYSRYVWILLHTIRLERLKLRKQSIAEERLRIWKTTFVAFYSIYLSCIWFCRALINFILLCCSATAPVDASNTHFICIDSVGSSKFSFVLFSTKRTMHTNQS